MNDLRAALRQVAHRPGLTAAALLTLALGIGGSTAVFSLVEAVLVRPLPFTHPEQLVFVWQRSRGLEGRRMRVPAPDVAVYREQAQGFQDFAFINRVVNAVLVDGRRSEYARVGLVSGNLFSLLGARPALGRLFAPDEALLSAGASDASPGAAPPSVILVTDRMWRTRFGGDTTVVGRTVILNGQPMTIVGVLPADFDLLLPADAGLPPSVDAWTPLRTELRLFARDEGEWRDQDSDNTGVVIGRLQSGTTLERARATMVGVASRQRRDVPFYAQAHMTVEVEPMHADIVRHVRPALWLVLGVVLAVLLIACLNVAGLLMARAIDRRREMALRAALGASRRRLFRQVFLESGLLALGGSAAGLLIATWGVPLLLMLGPADLPGAESVSVNASVLAFSAVVTLLALAVFGTAPAWRLSESDGAGPLEAHGRAGTPRGPVRARKALVVTQVALASLLLVAAGLLLRSFARLQQVDPGFDPAGVATFRVTLPDGTVGGPGARAELMSRVADEVRAIPGVEAVGLIGGLPLTGEVWRQPFGLAQESPEEWARNQANFRVVTSDYFRAMGIRVLAGRAFTPREDVVEEERVVIVDAAAADRIAAGGAAVGHLLAFPLDGRATVARIVGVVDDVRHDDLRTAGLPTIYVPYRQEASRTVAFAVRTTADPTELAAPIARRVADLNGPTPVPVYDFRSLEQYVRAALAPTRFVLTVVALFGGAALALALIGLYGLMAYTVGQRTHEIGVRVALGAHPGHVLRGVIGGGLRLALAGVAVGLVLSLLTLRLVSGLLFAVSVTDPVTYLAMTTLLLLVAAAACYPPAHRASRIDPAEALRHA